MALSVGVAIGRMDYNRQIKIKNAADSAITGISKNAVNQTLQNGQGDVAVASDISASSALDIGSMPQSQSSGYLIKAADGMLTVYADGNTESPPYMSVEIDFDNLPQNDRTLLQNGIYAQNDAQLQQILEDYTG